MVQIVFPLKKINYVDWIMRNIKNCKFHYFYKKRVYSMMRTSRPPYVISNESLDYYLHIDTTSCYPDTADTFPIGSS